MPKIPLLSTGLKAIALGWALVVCAATATAAPLPDTPETLVEKSRLLRESRDRVWDPASGLLGNLQHVRIVADGCTVRVVSGADNRLIGPHGKVQVTEDRRSAGGQAPPRDVALSVRAERGELPRGTVCLTLQVATADDFILSGNDAAFLFDRVELPAMRIYLNPSSPLRVWFQDVKLGLLSLRSNANALAGGTGQVQWLQLDSSQGSTAMFFHGMDARHIGVSSTTTRPRYSIRIGADTKAGYHQPARAPRELAQLYPIWIDGSVGALEVPAGSVNAMPLTPAIRSEAQVLRDEVLARAGPSPVLQLAHSTASTASTASTTQLPAAPVPVAPRQQVADGFGPYLPPGVEVTAVQMWNAGGALEGTAPNAEVVRTLVQSLGRSPDVRYAQLGYTRPQGAQVAFRVVFDLACAAPGAASVCPAGSGGAYTEEQVRNELLPLLGPQVVLNRLQLRDGWVLLQGRATDADAKAALERIGQQAPWIRISTTEVGNGNFSARMELVCKAPPPRQGGICQAASTARR